MQTTKWLPKLGCELAKVTLLLVFLTLHSYLNAIVIALSLDFYRAELIKLVAQANPWNDYQKLTLSFQKLSSSWSLTLHPYAVVIALSLLFFLSLANKTGFYLRAQANEDHQSMKWLSKLDSDLQKSPSSWFVTTLHPYLNVVMIALSLFSYRAELIKLVFICELRQIHEMTIKSWL